MQQEPKRKESGFNWLGIVIFLLVAVGPTLWRFVGRLFSGTGFALPAGVPIPALLLGAVVVAVLAGGVINVVRRSQRRSETQLPTSLPTTLSAPMRAPTSTTASRTPNAPMPPFGGEFGPFFPTLPNTFDSTLPKPAAHPQFPSPPGFEPIISGKAVLASMALFSAFGLAYLIVSAVLP